MPIGPAPVGTRVSPVGPAQPISRVGSGMPRPVGGPVAPKMPSYKKGGTVKKTGPALVHKGEKIQPVKAKSKTPNKKKK